MDPSTYFFGTTLVAFFTGILGANFSPPLHQTTIIVRTKLEEANIVNSLGNINLSRRSSKGGIYFLLDFTLVVHNKITKPIRVKLKSENLCVKLSALKLTTFYTTIRNSKLLVNFYSFFSTRKRAVYLYIKRERVVQLQKKYTSPWTRVSNVKKLVKGYYKKSNTQDQTIKPKNPKFGFLPTSILDVKTTTYTENINAINPWT